MAKKKLTRLEMLEKARNETRRAQRRHIYWLKAKLTDDSETAENSEIAENDLNTNQTNTQNEETN
jgi:hypothetical protein